MNIASKLKYTAALMCAAAALLTPRSVSADDLTRDSRRALQQLVAQNPAHKSRPASCFKYSLGDRKPATSALSRPELAQL